MRIGSGLVLVFLASFLYAGDFWLDKDYTSWTQKECETMLTKSPWVFSNSFSQVSAFGPMGVGDQGERERTITFRFRLLSAKPIRMAIGQLQLLGRPGDAVLGDQTKRMIETPPDKDNRILVQIEFSVRPPGDSSQRDIHSFLLNSSLSDFRDSTYLSSSDKALVPLLEYRPPTAKQPNAVFIFPRRDANGEPLFTGREKWIALKTEILSHKVYARNPAEKMKFQGGFEL